MAHTTIGLDIGSRAIRYAVCTGDPSHFEIKTYGSIPIPDDPAQNTPEDALELALNELVKYLEPFRKLPIDAIGLTLDPTKALSTHKTMALNDPEKLQLILPQALSDYWNIDDDTQIAFEVGELLSQHNSATESEEPGDEGGYDIHIINYPKPHIVQILDTLKKHDIDPHVVLPSNEALGFLIGTLVPTSNKPWAMLDIGEKHSVLSICNGNKIVLTRSFKIGGASLDEAIAETFSVPLDEARRIKHETGFVAHPGTEQNTYREFIENGKLKPWEIDPVALSGCCARTLTQLVASVRQSLVHFVTKTHQEPVRLYLVGGCARLCGIDTWITQFLGLESLCTPPPNLNPYSTPDSQISIDAAAIAIAAERNIDGACPLNLRRGALAHKGSLAILQDNKWLFASLILLVIASLIFMTLSHSKAIQKEHDTLKAALEATSQKVFGKKLISYSQIEKEIQESQGFSFIPDRTAFTHFSWISSQVNDNLSDVEMDINSLDIDTQRKIVTIRGEVTGDDGLPKFMQLLEQYECFPNEIAEPKTSKTKDRTAFTLRIDANRCSGGENE